MATGRFVDTICLDCANRIVVLIDTAPLLHRTRTRCADCTRTYSEQTERLRMFLQGADQ